MQRRILLELVATFALGVNYAGAYILAVIWNWPSPETELYVHILALFCASFLFGALIVNMRKALLYTIASIAIGIAVAVLFIALPSLMAGGSYEAIDLSFTIAISTISRLFIVGMMFQLMGPIAGCFLGDMLFHGETL